MQKRITNKSIFPKVQYRCVATRTRPRSWVVLSQISACVCTPAASPTPLRALLALRQSMHQLPFSRMAEQIATMWHNPSRAGREVRHKEKIKDLGNCKIKSPLLRAIVFNCGKGFALKWTGPRSCVRHLTVLLDKDKEKLRIKVQNHAVICDVPGHLF